MPSSLWTGNVVGLFFLLLFQPSATPIGLFRWTCFFFNIFFSSSSFSPTRFLRSAFRSFSLFFLNMFSFEQEIYYGGDGFYSLSLSLLGRFSTNAVRLRVFTSVHHRVPFDLASLWRCHRPSPRALTGFTVITISITIIIIMIWKKKQKTKRITWWRAARRRRWSAWSRRWSRTREARDFRHNNKCLASQEMRATTTTTTTTTHTHTH